MYDLPRVWKISTTHRSNTRTSTISIAQPGNRFILLEKNGFSDGGRCVLKVHFGEEIAWFYFHSCVHWIVYDCHWFGLVSYNQEWQQSMLQQFLQCYSILHQTNSPNHPRSNGFTECMVGVAKKLMDKAGSERKPWISGLFEYRITPQTGSIASPLQLMTQHKPREKNLPQFPSALGEPEMHQMHQELIKRQGNKPERVYQELLSGTPVRVQHRQNAQWEPAVVVNQTDAPNSYWIMQENSALQSKIYRCTRTFLKIRSTPTNGEAKAQMKEWMPEMVNTVSGTSCSQWKQKPHGREFSGWIFIWWHAATSANTRSSKFPKFFRNEGGRWPACRITVHKWYYTGNCTECTKCTNATQVNKKELWSGAPEI